MPYFSTREIATIAIIAALWGAMNKHCSPNILQHIQWDTIPMRNGSVNRFNPSP